MKPLNQYRARLIALGLTLSGSIAVFLAGCTTSTPLPPPAPTLASIPTPQPPPPLVVIPALPTFVSQAGSPFDYRLDAAHHLYSKNIGRIYHGKMPPLLYAIGVLQVDVDGNGRVTGTRWMRAPRHAPEVMADIERTVLAAAPYPAPIRMGRVTYTDTWLWHKSGTFQLDTLTEGQF